LHIEQTIEKLNAMKLGAIVSAYLEQHKNPTIASLSFDERLSLLVEAEYLARENRKLSRLLGDAQFRISIACIEEIDYTQKRNIDKAQIHQLASCRFVKEHHNIIITGPTGVGKTYVACALGQQACRKGYRVIYKRVPRLLEELYLAHADGSYPRFLAKIAKADILILDDWAIAPLKETQRHDVLEIVEDRENLRSTIVTSQLPVANWHDHIGDPTIADAILDRLVHNAFTVTIKGPSQRKEKAKKITAKKQTRFAPIIMREGGDQFPWNK